jgi:hypothetical protein
MKHFLKKLTPLCAISILGISLGLLWLIAFRALFRASLDEGMTDIQREMDRIACQQTAVFVIEQMSITPTFADRFALLDHSLASVDPKLEGSHCEFGVFTGTTINHVASRVKQRSQSRLSRTTRRDAA